MDLKKIKTKVKKAYPAAKAKKKKRKVTLLPYVVPPNGLSGWIRNFTALAERQPHLVKSALLEAKCLSGRSDGLVKLLNDAVSRRTG